VGGVAGLKKVLDPWLEQEHDADRRQLVLEAIFWAGEHTDEVKSGLAVDGHPQLRTLEVTGAGVRLVFIAWDLPPLMGLQLVEIEQSEFPC
jgi:hypothetical protein